MIDSFGRKHNYLRISLTEKCNLRCTYCMPEEGITLQKSSKYMNSIEVLEMAKHFVKLGVTKIRLTGGEPMVRKDFGSIVQELGKLPVELTLTTNAVFADQFITEMKSAGIRTINISLDTLKRKRFQDITRRDDFDKVLQNIRLLKNEFKVKINVVLMKGVNDDEIIDFVKFSGEENIEVRFIEFMPFLNNSWDDSKTVKQIEIVEKVAQFFKKDALIQENTHKNDTCKVFSLSEGNMRFGVISTISNPFCDSCNRLRLTADGKLKNCLFSQDETDLLTAFRNNEDIAPLIQKSVSEKKKGLGGLERLTNESVKELSNRAMISIGG